MKKTKVFVVSDTHFPFHNKKALGKVLNAIRVEKPTHVVQIGDLLDQYVFSKYSRTLSIDPNEEITSGIAYAQTFWAFVKMNAPKAKRIQLMGNHDMRLAKRIKDLLPELESFVSTKSLYQFPGVKVLDSDRDSIVIDGVTYTHGHLSKSIDHAIHFGTPIVHGHRHRPEISTKGKLWSMDVGYIADIKSIPLSYTATTKTNWCMAYGIVENGKPKLVLL